MVYTIYDVAVERMKKASQEMADIIETFVTFGRSDNLLIEYTKKKQELTGMGIWQDKYDFYAQRIFSEKDVSEEIKQGLAKLVEGKIE